MGLLYHIQQSSRIRILPISVTTCNASKKSLFRNDKGLWHCNCTTTPWIGSRRNCLKLGQSQCAPFKISPSTVNSLLKKYFASCGIWVRPLNKGWASYIACSSTFVAWSSPRPQPRRRGLDHLFDHLDIYRKLNKSTFGFFGYWFIVARASCLVHSDRLRLHYCQHL